MTSFLDFEKPIAEIEGRIHELRHVSDSSSASILEEVSKLQGRVDKMLQQTYAKLDPWQKTQVARHAGRPHFSDYISRLIDDFIPLSGDRNFSDDPAMIGGLGRFRGKSVMIIGHEKGADTESRLHHNFGMPHPEGYRKAIRLFRLAERFGLPVITLVDTSGAHPGVEAEERGQAEAIARSIETCLDLRTPLISLVIGEGGSGGAIAIAVANKVMMMEHSIYSVISPEGCASILWRSAEYAKDAAEALKMTAQDLFKLELIDTIIEEPIGGAHRDPEKAMDSAANAIAESLKSLSSQSGEDLRKNRRLKFLKMGDLGLT
tara:strand:- start:23355 stop:24311 length:957 start_codon:yes stop_codon:yes gene_type:complete